MTGHSGGVLSLAFSPNQTILASSSEDGTIKLWDFQQGIILSTQTVDPAIISSIAISPDGKFMAGGSNDGKIRLWKIEMQGLSQQPLSEISGYSPITFGIDSHTLICRGENHQLLVWRCRED